MGIVVESKVGMGGDAGGSCCCCWKLHILIDTPWPALPLYRTPNEVRAGCDGLKAWSPMGPFVALG